MENQIYRNMIVANNHIELARNICSTLAPNGGANMFTTPLEDSSNTITHWISSGFIDEQFANLMPLIQWDYNVDDSSYTKQVLSNGSSNTIQYLCSQAESPLETSIDDIELLFASSDVTTEEPFSAINRLNLKIHTPTEI